MKLKQILTGSLLAGIIFVSCAENNTNKEAGDTIHTDLSDTVTVPNQDHSPDMSTIQVPDTMPEKKDTVKQKLK